MSDVAFVEQRRQLPSPAPSPSPGTKNRSFTVVFTRQKTDHVQNEHRAPSLSANAVKAELKRRQVHFNVNEIQNVREVAAYVEGGAQLVFFYVMTANKAREKAFQSAIRKLSSFDLLEDSKYTQLPNGSFCMSNSTASQQSGISSNPRRELSTGPSAEPVTGPTGENGSEGRRNSTTDSNVSSVRVRVKRQSQVGSDTRLNWDVPVSPLKEPKMLPGSRSPPFDVVDAREPIMPAIPPLHRREPEAEHRFTAPSVAAAHPDPPAPEPPLKVPIPTSSDTVAWSQSTYALGPEEPSSSTSADLADMSREMPGYLGSIWQDIVDSGNSDPDVLAPPLMTGQDLNSATTAQRHGGSTDLSSAPARPNPSPSHAGPSEHAAKSSTASAWAPGPSDPLYVSRIDPTLPNGGRATRGSVSAPFWGPRPPFSVEPAPNRSPDPLTARSTQIPRMQPSPPRKQPSPPPAPRLAPASIPAPIQSPPSHSGKRPLSAVWTKGPPTDARTSLKSPVGPPMPSSSTVPGSTDRTPSATSPVSLGHATMASMSSAFTPSPHPGQGPSIAKSPSPTGRAAVNMQALVPDQVAAHMQRAQGPATTGMPQSTNSFAPPPGLHNAGAQTQPARSVPPRHQQPTQPIPTFISESARTIPPQHYPPSMPPPPMHHRSGSINMTHMPNLFAQPPMPNMPTSFPMPGHDSNINTFPATSTNASSLSNNINIPNAFQLHSPNHPQGAFFSAGPNLPQSVSSTLGHPTIMQSMPLGLGLPPNMAQRPPMPGVPQFHPGMADWMRTGAPQFSNQGPVQPRQTSDQYAGPAPGQWAQQPGHPQPPHLTVQTNGPNHAPQPSHMNDSHPTMSPPSAGMPPWYVAPADMSNPHFPPQDPRRWANGLQPSQIQYWQSRVTAEAQANAAQAARVPSFTGSSSLQAQARAQANAVHAARVPSTANGQPPTSGLPTSNLNAGAAPFKPPASAPAEASISTVEKAGAPFTSRSVDGAVPPSATGLASDASTRQPTNATEPPAEGPSTVQKTPARPRIPSNELTTSTPATAGPASASTVFLSPLEVSGSSSVIRTPVSPRGISPTGNAAKPKVTLSTALRLEMARPSRLTSDEIDTLLTTAQNQPLDAALFSNSQALDELDRAATAFFERAQRSINSVQISLSVNLRGLIKAMYQPDAVLPHMTAGVIERFMAHVLGILEIGPLEDISHRPMPRALRGSQLEEEEDQVLRQVVVRICRTEYASIYQRVKTRLPSYITILEAPEPTD